MEGGKAGDISRYSFLHVFANDPTIDVAELDFIKRLAMHDGQIDEDEKRVLARIFSRVSESTVDEAVWKEIQRFKGVHGIE
jgi:translation initiation factor 2 beta subunit (eIF-2beta)/eIF-5